MCSYAPSWKPWAASVSPLHPIGCITSGSPANSVTRKPSGTCIEAERWYNRIVELKVNPFRGMEFYKREAELLAEIERIDAMEPPPHEGLDIAAKRSINFMILSFAQQLYLDFYEDNLATLGFKKEKRPVDLTLPAFSILMI